MNMFIYGYLNRYLYFELFLDCFFVRRLTNVNFAVDSNILKLLLHNIMFKLNINIIINNIFRNRLLSWL